MTIQQQITDYINSQSESKCNDLEQLHRMVLELQPDCQLWFLDGKNAEGKVVSNPNIGYGVKAIEYADGKTRDFYQIGISANTTGISIYIMGIKDKKYLGDTFGQRLGKANLTGYCIKFKSLKDLNLEVLKEVLIFGFENIAV
jgi:hypothetical protein